MDGETNEPRKFSYPNADRTSSDTGKILGPEPLKSESSAPQPHPTVHLNEALNGKDAANAGFEPSENIRTFQSDVANAIKTDNVSLIKIALAEKKRQERQGTYDGTLDLTSSPKTMTYVIVAIVALLVIGGGFLAWFSFGSTVATPASPTNTSITAPIFTTESTLKIDVAQKDIADVEKIVADEKNKDDALGSIEQFTFVNSSGSSTQQLDTATWFDFLQVRMPDSLIRSFDPNFIFGIYSISPKQSFVILKVNSYDNAYAGMLQWEPYMDDDIGNLLENPQPLTVIGDTTSTTTSSSSSSFDQFNGKPFVDQVVDNKDSRVLLDGNGNIKLLYTFFDQNTLIIASGEAVLKEVIFRLTTGRISR